MKEEKKTLHLMGTVIQLWVVHSQPQFLLEQAEKMLRDFAARFSANDEKSELMAVNLRAGREPYSVSSDLYNLIKIGKTHSLPQGSALNIAIGPLIQLWRVGFSNAKKPSADEIKACMPLIQPEHILLDDENRSVFLKYPGMAIDLGALAKGFFADELRKYFQSKGAAAGLIDLGGNVVSFGEAPQHQDGFWRIGIQDPQKNRGNYTLALKIKNQSLVTSGIYERTFTYEEKTYHHIFDRMTGYPIETEIASITVLSENSLDGEIWTTRLFKEPPQQVLNILTESSDLAGIIITKRGEALFTNSIKSQIIPM